MRVEVNGKADVLLQILDENFRRMGLYQPGHILDAKDMRPCVPQLLAQLNIVFEVVFRTVGIQYVPCIADRGFANLSRVEYGVDRDPHVFDPVEAVEDPEKINAGVCRLLDEKANHVVRVACVPYAVRSAEKHLQQDVRDSRPKVAKPLPWTLLQEPVRDVECGSAPAFQ